MLYEQVKELAAEPFKRSTGVKLEIFGVMVEALRQAEKGKRKSGRPSKLSLEDQMLRRARRLPTASALFVKAAQSTSGCARSSWETSPTHFSPCQTCFAPLSGSAARTAYPRWQRAISQVGALHRPQ